MHHYNLKHRSPASNVCWRFDNKKKRSPVANDQIRTFLFHKGNVSRLKERIEFMILVNRCSIVIPIDFIRKRSCNKADNNIIYYPLVLVYFMSDLYLLINIISHSVYIGMICDGIGRVNVGQFILRQHDRVSIVYNALEVLYECIFLIIRFIASG